jgi:hypothetical protein
VKIRLRLCDTDRAEYGGEEWLTFDSEQLNALRASELERIEKQMGPTVLNAAVDCLNGNTSAVGVRGLIWLTRYLSGLRTPFEDFNIHTFQTSLEVVKPKPDTEETDVPLDDSSLPSEAPA